MLRPCFSVRVRGLSEAGLRLRYDVARGVPRLFPLVSENGISHFSEGEKNPRYTVIRFHPVDLPPLVAHSDRSFLSRRVFLVQISQRQIRRPGGREVFRYFPCILRRAGSSRRRALFYDLIFFQEFDMAMFRNENNEEQEKIDGTE